MTRFIMSIQEAVDLIFKVTKMSCGGEIFILKMPAINIQDLVEVMIEKISLDYNYQQEDIKINIIGKRAGEKIYEELSIKIHSFDEDEEQFKVSLSDIEKHFRLLQDLPLKETTDKTKKLPSP